MTIEKINPGELRYKEGMRYKINFNSILLYFTESALKELECGIAEIRTSTNKNDCAKCKSIGCQ